MVLISPCSVARKRAHCAVEPRGAKLSQVEPSGVKEEEVADFQDDFTHIGVSINYTRRADDLEEDLDEAEYEDIADMEGESEEE